MSHINGVNVSTKAYEASSSQTAAVGSNSTKAASETKVSNGVASLDHLNQVVGAAQSGVASAGMDMNSLAKVLELVTTLLTTLMSLLGNFMKGCPPQNGQVGNQPNPGDSAGSSSGSESSQTPVGGSAGGSNSAPANGATGGATTAPNDEAPKTETPANGGATPGQGQAGGATSSTPQNGTAAPGNSATTTPGENKVAPNAPQNDTSVDNLQAIQSDTGEINVRTNDGYEVRFEGKECAWVITGPDGKSTRIWGDPHVYESDGDKWDFLKRGTFVFGKNKATVEVVPAGNGQTISARVTIYSGNERVTISDIDKNKPVISAVAEDGKQHDDSLDDGDVYTRELVATGEEWMNKNAQAMA